MRHRKRGHCKKKSQKSFTTESNALQMLKESTAHLSKGSSGCKQKCTQFLTPFTGIVFHALSHGVIHFVQSVSFKNLEMVVF